MAKVANSIKTLTMASQATGKKRQKQSPPTVEDLLMIGKDMMKRSEKKMGAIECENRQFRELFGVNPEVALKA